MGNIKPVINTNKPYSDEDYEEAKKQGLDLDNWNDFERYMHLGEDPINDM